MRTPKYRLHRASGQAIATFKGRDIYLGAHGTNESKAYYARLLKEYQERGEVTAAKPPKRDEGPAYRIHRASGQAIVSLGGRDYYLGVYGSAQSKAEYHRIKSEYYASGCAASYGSPADELTIAQLVAGYVSHAKQTYGTGPESEYLRAKPILSILVRLYGHTYAMDFGPLQFEVVRNELLKPYVTERQDGTRSTRYRSRTYINAMMKRLRAVFRWAASKAILPVTILEAIKTVAPLRYGRTTAPELDEVQSVPDETVEQTLPHLNHVVRAMVKLQQLTGARPGEICRIKPSMVVRSSPDMWQIVYEAHKTAYKGKKRSIAIGPKAIEVLSPFLERGADEYCFSPAEAVERLRQIKHAARKTPKNAGNKPGSNRKKKPQRVPGACYTTQTYGRSVRQACLSAGIEPWAVNRLRHSFATKIAREMTVEHASQALGHSDTRITQTYLDIDNSKAIESARRFG